MFKPGLVSITFRKLNPAEIVALVAQAGLDAIEWGGDIHVPHGDLDQAKLVRQQTLDAGLEIAAYGSYYRFDDQVAMENVVETALILGAPVVRVWAGKKGSAQTTPGERDLIVGRSLEMADLAAKVGLTIAYEYHQNTLTDTVASARELLNEVDHPHITCYWQPLTNLSLDQRLQGIKEVGSRLANVHVYHWDEKGTKLPLALGADYWDQYMQALVACNLDHQVYTLIEFVRDGTPEQFLEDAAYLRRLTESYKR